MVIRLTRDIKFLFFVFLLSIATVIQVIPMCRAQSTDNNKIPLPVIMYHQITENKKRVNKYCILKSVLEEDLKYIARSGYTTITVKELLDHMEKNTPLPEKPIMITFDDGFESIKEYVLPLLEKYNMKAVVSVVGDYADNSEKQNDRSVSYSYLTWDDIAKLVKDERVEIQNHSYSFHSITKSRKGAGKSPGEDEDTYRKLLSEDINRFQNKLYSLSGYRSTAFTYPFGSFSQCSGDILKENGYSVAFICSEKMNYIDRSDRGWLLKIGRYNRDASYSTYSFFQKALKTENQ